MNNCEFDIFVYKSYHAYQMENFYKLNDYYSRRQTKLLCPKLNVPDCSLSQRAGSKAELTAVGFFLGANGISTFRSSPRCAECRLYHTKTILRNKMLLSSTVKEHK